MVKGETKTHYKINISLCKIVTLLLAQIPCALQPLK